MQTFGHFQVIVGPSKDKGYTTVIHLNLNRTPLSKILDPPL